MTQGNPALPQTRARRPGLPWLPLIHGAAGIPALPASCELSSQPGLALFSFPRAEKGTSSQKPAHGLMLVLSIPQPHSRAEPQLTDYWPGSPYVHPPASLSAQQQGIQELMGLLVHTQLKLHNSAHPSPLWLCHNITG